MNVVIKNCLLLHQSIQIHQYKKIYCLFVTTSAELKNCYFSVACKKEWKQRIKKKRIFIFLQSVILSVKIAF